MHETTEKEPPRLADLSLRQRLVLSWGKVRRFYLLSFRPTYVEKSLERRRGQCNRSGACCNLAFACPKIDWLDCLPTCSIYGKRPRNCTAFPIDERDLRDRDILSPEEPCGYSFSPR
jgi:hypothetical protein